ncbi:hypothetical protein IRJ41_004760 [Triplophysa rosa]|uniref:Uncharacterized protein n=1 Tax=Triplophysa rosa TaxID=992332 RepID=A0A9W7TRM3_TRIRA|nr:hypothetical protein IRJ41_004760 [Triplophysa rosa]
MMLLIGGDCAGSGFPSCATRFPSVSVDLSVLSLRHLTFSERDRTTKKREQGGTGRGYHACAVTEDKTQPDTRRNKKEAADISPLLSRTSNKDKSI